MKIKIDSKTFSLSQSGNVVGGIWFDFSNQNFPEINWADSVSVVLSWWLIEWERFSELDGRSATFRFMEGPFQLEIFKKEGDRAEVSLIERGSTKSHLVGKFEVPQLVIKEQLKLAADDLLKVASANEWTSKEIKEIGRLAKSWSR